MEITAIALYGLVTFVSLLFVLGELLQTFGRHLSWALGHSWWSWLLILLNLGTADATYCLVRLALNVGNDPLTAVVVAAAYPILLRSRFTVFRQVGAADDQQLTTLSIPMDNLYTAIQQRCVKQVGSEVAMRRTLQPRQLAAAHTEQELTQAIKELIAANQVPANRAENEKYLRELSKVADEGLRKFRLAVFRGDLSGDKAASLFGR